MAKNILEVAPVARSVKTHKYGELEVNGLTVAGIVHLIKNRPELFNMFNSQGEQLMEIEGIMSLGEEIFAEFLAAGLGQHGNDEVIRTCKMMNPDDTWTIAEAILEESFPGGAANFFNRVMEALDKTDILQASQDLKDKVQSKQSEQAQAA